MVRSVNWIKIFSAGCKRSSLCERFEVEIVRVLWLKMLLITAGELESVEFETVVLASHPGTNRLSMYHLSIWLSAVGIF